MPKKIARFEKYLTLWVSLCILLGILLGNFFEPAFVNLSNWNIGSINIPVAILVWLMIYPMMVQIDFSSIKNISKNLKGLWITLTINWLVKPFTMAFFAYSFFYFLYQTWITPEEAEQYLAGAILLGAAPCTAMVFVWSYLTDGDANYTLVQVSVNDLILLVAFIPIIAFLFDVFEITINDSIGLPYKTLLSSILIFVVFPLVTGYISNRFLIKTKGITWFKSIFLKRLKPLSVIALLSTLIFIFAFQGHTILAQPLTILLIAIPLTVQTYFIFFLTWGLGKYFNLKHSICAPSAMIGASNFFELAVAIAISLFGLNSGASLATVVGILIEVPIMLSLVKLANNWKY